ncbi:MAG: hypothetical protein CMJ54_10525 [Planctomycetaceae bacterium]|nr:hypothetical protein [Planctomycetaceae bacterium]
MGVSALFASAVSGLSRRLPDLGVTVFDSGLGLRSESHQVDDADPIPLRFVGFRTGRRYYRSENIEFMKIAAKLGGLGKILSSGVREVIESDVILDVSGGDSFTDMYPDDRIDNIAGSKEFVLDEGRPLLLLPQTYGPFDESLDRASRIVRRSAACFARDERSFENLKSMLGAEFDPDRHRCGVDMAFGLAVRDPGDRIAADIRSVLDDSSTPTIGLNLSGLLGNTPGVDKSRYGFRADYRQTLIRLLSKILADTEAHVVLVPHVMSPEGAGESDLQTCRWLRSEFDEEFSSRIKISPTHLDQCEVKWVISRMDWFCGTRMHATIASLSTDVATATISYSDKAIGVFETCGQGEEVFDPRVLEEEAIVEGLMDSYRRRHEISKGLTERIRMVKERAKSQMDEIAAIVTDLGGR